MQYPRWQIGQSHIGFWWFFIKKLNLENNSNFDTFLRKTLNTVPCSWGCHENDFSQRAQGDKSHERRLDGKTPYMRWEVLLFHWYLVSTRNNKECGYVLSHMLRTLVESCSINKSPHWIYWNRDITQLIKCIFSRFFLPRRAFLELKILSRS